MWTKGAGGFFEVYDGTSGKSSMLSMTELTVNDRDILRTHQSLVGGWFANGAITANANLNTQAYMKIGRWTCTTAVANTLTNTPVYTEFVMTVRAATQTGDIDNESGTWVYRIREIETWNGRRYAQFAYVGGTAGSWVFGDWLALGDASQVTTGSLAMVTGAQGTLNDVRVRQRGSIVNIRAYISGVSTAQELGNLCQITGDVQKPKSYVRATGGSGMTYWQAWNNCYIGIDSSSGVIVCRKSPQGASDTVITLNITYSAD